VPVIRWPTRTELARRWHDLMDVNRRHDHRWRRHHRGGGLELFRLMLDVASGRKKTWAERWKLHNSLCSSTPRR